MRLLAQTQHTQHTRCRAVGGPGFRYRARGISLNDTCTNETQQYRHRGVQRAGARPSRRGAIDSSSVRQPSTDAATDPARSAPVATSDSSASLAQPSDSDPAVPGNAPLLESSTPQGGGRVPRQPVFSPTYRQFDLSSHVNKRRVRANWKVAHFAEIWTLAKNKFLRVPDEDQYIDSPPFGDDKVGTWFLRLYPYGDVTNAGSLELYLMVDSSLSEDLIVHYKLQIVRQQHQGSAATSNNLKQNCVIQYEDSDLYSKNEPGVGYGPTHLCDVSTKKKVLGLTWSDGSLRIRALMDCPITDTFQGPSARQVQRSSAGRSVVAISQLAMPPPGGKLDNASAFQPLNTKTLSEELLDFVTQQENDLEIHFRGERFTANRLVLASRSKVFCAMLNGRFQEGNGGPGGRFAFQSCSRKILPALPDKDLDVPSTPRDQLDLSETTGLSAAALRNLLEYMHTDMCPLLTSVTPAEPRQQDADNIGAQETDTDRVEALLELLAAADLYDVQSLYDRCVNEITGSLSRKNFASVLLCASRINCRRLVKATRQFASSLKGGEVAGKMLQLFEAFWESGTNIHALPATKLLPGNPKAGGGFEDSSVSSPGKTSEPGIPTTSICLGCTAAGSSCSSKSDLLQCFTMDSPSTLVKRCERGGAEHAASALGTHGTLPVSLSTAVTANQHTGHANGNGITRRATTTRHAQRLCCTSADCPGSGTELRCSVRDTPCALGNFEDDPSSTSSDSPRTVSPSHAAPSKRELLASPRRRPAHKKQRVIGPAGHHSTWVTDEEAFPAQLSLRTRRRSSGVNGGIRRDLQWHSDSACQAVCSPACSPPFSPGRRKLPANSGATGYRRWEAATVTCPRSHSNYQLPQDRDSLSPAVCRGHCTSTSCATSSAAECESPLLQSYNAHSQSMGEKEECASRTISTGSLSLPHISSLDKDSASSPSIYPCCSCRDDSHSPVPQAPAADNAALNPQGRSRSLAATAASTPSESETCPQALNDGATEERSSVDTSARGSCATTVAAAGSRSQASGCTVATDRPTGTADEAQGTERTAGAELTPSGQMPSISPGSAHTVASSEPGTAQPKRMSAGLEASPPCGGDRSRAPENSKTSE
ncbi:btb poz domain-containing protein [Cystoisospora suis]|uniref:Btb poz domain-containing protein n=1 Tax=Cystoisospora suis TaxID=483139 RepID=A0A2C6KZT7_9APIC|nr:btb poz domain-containing protein [Cystoisospora suis]